jgi:hypothetical protein
MDNALLTEFLRRYRAAVAGGGPVLPTLPSPAEVADEESPSVFLEEEMHCPDWKPLIVLEAPARQGEFPRRFIDGSQHHVTILWLRCPAGTPIAMVLGEVGAVALVADGRQFRRESVAIERVLSFVADPFPWEEIEEFSAALWRHPMLQLRVVLANKPVQPHHPFDYERMRGQAVSRISQEMNNWERLIWYRNRDSITLIDGPLHRVMGEPSAEAPLVVGVVKTPLADYLHDQGWRTLFDLRPGQRTPVFRIAGKGGPESKEGRFPVASWYLKLAGGPRIAPHWGYVRVEIPWNQFQTQFQGDFAMIGRLSRWLMDARCRQESYARLPVSLEPVVRAEEVIKPLFTPLDSLSQRIYRQVGLVRSVEE